MGPLNHLRILDLSRVLAGPWATQCLADLGAEVIKVEQPGKGDDTRAWGPPFIRDKDTGAPGDSAYFLCANRGKRSVAIDFTQPEGQDLVRALAAKCDVVVENFKLGGLAKYGLDYAALKQVRPDLIYCSITGFGQDGPYAHRAGYDFLVQGMGGLMSLTGQPDGPPTKAGVAFADIFTGLYATSAILAALTHRDRTGEGQHIDLALLDVQVAVLANQAANYLVGGIVPGRLGNAHPNIVPYQEFQTADGWVILAIGNDGQFARFCAAAGEPDLAADARFGSNQDRVANREALIAVIQGVLRGRSSADWIALLEREGVPCGPINSLDQVFDDPQVRHRGMAVSVEHPAAGEVSLLANPIRFSATPVTYDRAPPELGEGTDFVLSDLLGLSGHDLVRLRAIGVL